MIVYLFAEFIFVLFLQAHPYVSHIIMADAFSSSSETVIQRAVDVRVKANTPVEKLEELYQISKTCEFIREHKFEKVGEFLWKSFDFVCWEHFCR